MEQGSMHADGFDDVLMEFAPTFCYINPLCRELRTILFPLTKTGKLDLTTKPNPRKLYDTCLKAALAVNDVGRIIMAFFSIIRTRWRTAQYKNHE